MNLIAPYLCETPATAPPPAPPARCPLIGFTGHAGAGKDSAAAVLAAAGWQTAAFADALRIEVASAFHVDIRLFTDPASKEAPLRALAAGCGVNANWLRFVAVNGYSLLDPRSPRWVMQRWGEFRRQHDPHHWVRYVLRWAAIERNRGRPGLAVTDVRFPNEALALRGEGGLLVRVHRRDLPPMAPDTASHESERHMALQVDADVANDGSLAELSAEVWRVVGRLLAPPHTGAPA